MKRLMLFVLVALLPARALAQSDRFEVGQRLRAFENAWETHKDEAARKRALAPMEKVTSFFQGRLDEVARTLDAARHLLATEKEPSANVRWAEALFVRPSTRFADTTVSELSVTLAPFYKVETEAPKDALLKLTLRDAKGKVLAAAQTAITALPLQAKLSLGGANVPEGDHTLDATIVVGGKSLTVSPEQIVSFAGKLPERIVALTKSAADLPAKPAVERETLRALTGLLEGLADKTAPETNLAAARLLTEAETVLKAIQSGKSYYGEGKTGQFWLRLPVGPKGTAVRLLAPEAVKQAKPLPLVVALHGAGGSENLFFDGYGAGEIVRQCQERGWLLVAPRTEGLTFTAPVTDIIEEVNRLYPVDRKRIFLVGHSMGAMQVVNAAQQTPERFAAVAALAGGGSVKKSEGIKALPFFVAVGSKDFMGGMVRGLKDSLTGAGATKMVFREYPDVEHIVVVRLALPEVFAFFDKAAKR